MQYAKALVAVLAAIASGIVGALTDGHITNPEWVNVAILAVGACAVFAAPNVPYARYTKAAIAVLTAVLTLLVSYISDGHLTAAEGWQLIVAGLGALGVYVTPNGGRTPAPAPAEPSTYRA